MTPAINIERLLINFMELCAIDAEPTRERAMADRLTMLLEELGFTVTEDDAGTKLGGTAGNLYASLAAKIQSHHTYSRSTRHPCGSNFHATQSRIIVHRIPRHFTRRGKVRKQLNNDIHPGRQLRVRHHFTASNRDLKIRC